MDEHNFNKFIYYAIGIILAYYVLGFVIKFLVWGVVGLILWRVYWAYQNNRK